MEDKELSKEEEEWKSYVIKNRTSTTQINEKVFRESYIPKSIPHRNNEMGLLMDAILDFQNIILYGQPSSGKTLLVRKAFKILRSIEEDNKKEKYIYINCRSAQNKPTILYKIVMALGGETPRLGVPFSVYYDEIEDIVEEKDINHTYICLDEYDILVKKYKRLDDITYYFSNTDLFKLILIGNTHDWFQETHDLRTRERFNEELMFFKDYSKKEMFDILKHRLKEGFPDRPNFLTDKELQHLTKIVYNKTGRLRLGIKTLGRLIDRKLNEDKEELKYFEIESLFKNEIELERSKTYTNLPLPEKFIIEIIITILENNENQPSWNDPTASRICKYWNDKCEEIHLRQANYLKIKRHLNDLLEREVIKKVPCKNKSDGRGRPPDAYEPNFDIYTYKKEVDKQINSKKPESKIGEIKS